MMGVKNHWIAVSKAEMRIKNVKKLTFCQVNVNLRRNSLTLTLFDAFLGTIVK